MDLTLFRLIGEAFVALAAGLGLASPEPTTVDGYRLVNDLLAGGEPDAQALVETTVEAVYHALAESADDAAVEPVLEGVRAMVDRYGRRPDVLATAAPAGPAGMAGDQISTAGAVTLAIFTAAVEEGTWPQNLDARLATDVLEALVGAVFRRSENIAVLGRLPIGAETARAPADEMPSLPEVPHSVAFPTPPPLPPVAASPVPPIDDIAASPWDGIGAPSPAPSRDPETGPAPEDVAIAADCGLKPEVIAALRQIAAKLGQNATDAVLTRRGRALVALIKSLATGRESDPVDTRQLRADAGIWITEGLLDRADQSLSLAEDNHLRGAQRDFHRVGFHMGRAADLRMARAELSAATGDLRRAARHVVSAMRCFPVGERGLQWPLRLKQGEFLAEAAKFDDVAALREAAAAFEAAAEDADSAGSPRGRTLAVIAWAAAAVAMAHHEQSTRLAAAASDALGDIIPQIAPGDDVLFGLAQLRLGQAIIAGAIGSPDLSRLVSASEAFAAAVGALQNVGGPELTEAQGWSGLTFASLARATNDKGPAERAIVPLDAALASAEAPYLFDAARLLEMAMSLGDAAQGAGFRRNDVRLLSLAATAYGRAIAGFAASDAELIGRLEEQRAACLWRRGQITGLLDDLDGAATAFRRAVAAAESQGDTMRAGLLRGELERLLISIDQAALPAVRDA